MDILKTSTYFAKSFKGSSLIKEFDLNKDGITDVIEMYKAKRVKEGLLTDLYPSAYGVDLNRNGRIEGKEMFSDKSWMK